MSDARPFNPTWLTVAAVVLTGVISGSVSSAVTSSRVEDLRARQDADDIWKAAIERRFSEEQLATGKTLVALSKDVEAANKTLESIRQALMGRGVHAYSTTTTP